MIHANSRFLLAAAGSLIFAGLASAEPTFSLIALGDLDGGDFKSTAHSFYRGQVVGGSVDATGTHAFIWDYNTRTMSAVQGLNGYAFSTARSINANGDITGYTVYENDPTVKHAYSWNAGTVNEFLSGYADVIDSRGNHYNNSGTITGWLEVANGGTRGYTWDGTDLTILESEFGSGRVSLARKTNNSGVSVGQYHDTNSNRYAGRWDDGSPSQIGGLAGYQHHRGATINDAGYIAGTSSNLADFSARVPWLYDPDSGTVLSLGLLDGYGSMGITGLNDDVSWITGKAFVDGMEDDPYQSAGALLVDGVWYDLNDLVDLSGEGFHIFETKGINEYGWILANAINADGYIEGILLIPAPATFAVAGLAFIFAGTRRRRKDC